MGLCFVLGSGLVGRRRNKPVFLAFLSIFFDYTTAHPVNILISRKEQELSIPGYKRA